MEGNRSILYESLKASHDRDYISDSTLRGRVELGRTKPEKGITEEEYYLITNKYYKSDKL